MKKKIAIINQRYGLEVNGGSELYSRQIAERLTAKYEVEVLTSCAIEYVKWSNHYKEGVETINNVSVRRFKTEHERTPRKFTALDTAMQQNPKASKEQSDRWIEEMGPYCPSLVNYIDEHQDDYYAIIVVTYLYYPAVKSIVKIKDKAIFIPTAHQEPFIHFKMYEEVFNAPKAYVFLTEEEKGLVHGIFKNEEIPYEVMGVGVQVPSLVDPQAFKKKYKLDNYIIYVGRIDEGKDCPRMFEYFLEYKKRVKSDLKLVLMGKAVVEIPNHKDIISLGFVSEEDKFNGIKGSKALILPSKFESLSISVLEAMTLAIPVVVNGICDVLKGHCTKSNGGLYYKNYFEFEGCLNFLVSHREEYEKMCQNAKKYVDDYFQWDDIMEKFDRIIERVGEQ
ncbi:glycosyltransferase family 4 protein [[Clostridium] fimetarium]|uniref:Glycosyltransferase involved in cell wall bisynthesis n=1 Tax=[Clostridium] fimetarium TaxID=99656 RepID=A0A1I0P0V4_9FIRM|nr:glycosyltransferase family 4 protein [[Clostridium] fimetarium]SEW07570.1 Glycosyltransferase involved in cell wall bisynthesis [[Clostridium] fimetarium]